MANATVGVHDRLRVFIAFARGDAGFADQLCALLSDSGFDAQLDRRDERARMAGLIAAADAVVLVLSDDAARSDVCAWAAQEASRHGKRIVPVMPAPLHGRAPRGVPMHESVRFYIDPAKAGSGFFDGQKQLVASLRVDPVWAATRQIVLDRATQWQTRHRAPALLLNGGALEDAIDWRQHAPGDASLPALVDDFLQACVAAQRSGVHEDVPAVRAELNTLNRELKKARGQIERIKREERDQRRKSMQRPYQDLPPPRYAYPPPLRRARGPKFPWLRAGFLLAVGGYVVAFFVSDGVRDKTRSIAAEAATWVETVHQATEPPRQHGVSADDYTPERDAFAGAAGANVRDYPLPHATLLVELPARSPLNINGRLNVQGEWWFRVVLPDQRIGFVHQSAIAWSRPPAAAAVQVANVTAVEPAVAARAGRAGAKIRVGPARNARVVVRIARNVDVSITGKRRIGTHWWYRVRLEDGREGFARDDVLTAPDGGRLRV